MKLSGLFKKASALVLAGVMCFGLFACGGDGNTPSGDTPDTGKIKVTVGYTLDYEEVYTKMIEAFEKEHPDIDVVGRVVSSSMYGQYEDMTALAAANNLPDICVGSEHFGEILMNGWAYPLDNLIAEDPDADSIMKQALINFSYGGYCYGLPMQIQFNSLCINLDLLEMLNEDAPDYDWTIEDFVALCNKSTTDQYSAINYIYNSANPTWGLDNKLMGSYIPDGYHQYGYSFETHNIDLTVNNAWVDSNKLLKSLLSVPGLVSDELKKTTTNGISDYEKKFGEGADALLSGKVLFGNHSTWEYSLYNKGTFEFDVYPMPTDSDFDQRIQTHFDFAYMTTKVTQENRKAAYEFLKFITYGDGCLIRIEENMKLLKEMPTAFKIYIPASQDPDVMAAFEATDIVPGIKYMYNKIIEDPGCILVADGDKLIPSFWNDIVQFRDSATQAVINGTDPAALVNDFQNSASFAVGERWTFFEAAMNKNITKFFQDHPWETPKN